MLLQTAALNHWPDGSVRWLLIDFLATSGGGPIETYTLYGRRPDAPLEGGLRLIETPHHIVVDTGRSRIEVAKRGPLTFRNLRTDKLPAVNSSRLVVTRDDGRTETATIARVTVEEQGPVKACVRLETTCGEAAEMIAIDVRLVCWFGLPVIDVTLSVRNPRPAHHPGGYWELGDLGSLFLTDVSLSLNIASTKSPVVECSTEPGALPRNFELPFQIYQDSSGGEHWHSKNHVDRFGRVTTSFSGYRVRSGTTESSGVRAQPIVRCMWEDAEIALAVRQFWENFPRVIEVTPDILKIGLLAQQTRPHELQGGEQKTHSVLVAFDRDTTGAYPLEWIREPVLAHASPEWYASTLAIPYLHPASADPNGDYLALVDAAIEGPRSFIAKREIADEYGWRHFGDLYADHEAVRHTGKSPLHSHYNNQYDAIKGFVIHFLRTGDPRWWHLSRDLASHVADIDIYHTTRDKSAYNGGMFWHTAHYVDAGTSTHRSYPRSPGVSGGGPANEHNYSTGLMLAYFLTGERRFRDAVLELAGWVINMDDGRRTVFRWIDRGNTGLASMTRSPLYHGPGRGAAYSVDTLLNAFELTNDGAYLDYAEVLIRRCIHPHDDVVARNLLDAEEKWHYTVFLQTIGRFLDYKAQLGSLDYMYAYARAALIRYATWMTVHEYPYLDKPEKLEYPTETWAAQDLRKSEVFMHASRHTSGGLHEQFLERAEFFFSYAMGTLRRMESSTLTRPLVLILTNGYMRSWFLMRKPPAAEPGPAIADFGEPQKFIPQKARAIRRALALVAVSGILLAIAAARMWRG